jgi:DNA primase
MANNIDWNDWETDNLTPLVFDKLDTILPELDFKFQKGNWYSSLKLDGTAPKERRHDKTVVKKELPGILIEAGEPARNIIKHYAETRNLQRYEARKELADKLGVELPQGDYTEQQPSERKRRGIMADAYAYFEYCLHSDSQGAKDVLNYLTQKRGYSLELIKAMGLGYIPSQKQLTDYLAKKYSAEEIKDAIKFNAKIGDTHKLAITRTSAGRVIGFNFRTIGDHKPKYIKPAGAELPIFINLPARISNTDLIIVEGEIDSLHAKALGFNNVVCVGRNDVSNEQLIDAQQRGFTSVTICFDNEPPNRKTNSAKALKIGNQAQALGFDVFVIELDELNPEKTDLDNYLTAMGKDAFTNLIATAHSLPIFKASVIASDYLDKLPLTEKDEHSLRKEIITVGLTVAPGLLPSFKNAITDALGIDFDKDAIAQTIEELQGEAKLKQQHDALKKLLNDTAKSEGTIDEIAQKLKKGLGEIEAKSTDLNKYLKPNTWADFVTKLNATPQGLRTGYIQGESKINQDTGEELNELLIPNKAITIIAGRSGHGKTTAMVNITLQLLQLNKHLKRVYFFTYEMPEEQLIERALLSFVGNGVGELFSKNPSGALRELIAKGNDQYIKTPYREAVKSYVNQFKNEYLETGRLTFVDARNKPIEEIRATITALRKRGEIDAVVIDYIQKFTSNQVKGTTGTALMKYVTDELNGLANDTELPIITGAQFNRSVDCLHQVSELAIREADDITHAGALILGIFNNEANPTKLGAYQKDATKEEQAKTNSYSHPNTFYVEVLKNRFGKAGIGFNLAYCGPLQTLGNYFDGAGIIDQGTPQETATPTKEKRATRPTK